MQRIINLFAIVLLAGCSMHVMPPTYVMFSSVADAQATDCDFRATVVEPCVLHRSVEPARLDSIATGTVAHASGDTLTFAIRISGVSSARIVGGVEAELRRADNTDIWSASLYVPRLDQAIIGYRVVTDTSTILGSPRQFRGADAPAPMLQSARLHGTLRVDTLVNATIGTREIVSYVPAMPVPRKGYDVVYAADGATVRQLAPYLDTLIVEGHIKPTVLVGIRAARPVPGDEGSKLNRAREYVYGFEQDSTRFLAHERFFIDQVLPWAETTLHASALRPARTVWGASNGGAFAVAMGLRHPTLFANIIASSPVYDVIPAAGTGPIPAFYITAGTFEETTRSRAKVLSDELKRRGALSRFELTVGGHDDVIWSEWFIRGMNNR